MNTPIKRYWAGTPQYACDICRSPLVDEFVDGATTRGPWAIMHPACHKMFGKGLGQGLGQRYQRQSEDGRWLKVEG